MHRELAPNIIFLILTPAMIIVEGLSSLIIAILCLIKYRIKGICCSKNFNQCETRLYNHSIRMTYAAFSYQRGILCRNPTQTMLRPRINRKVSGGLGNIPRILETFRVTLACVDSVSVHDYGPKSGQQA